MTMEEVINFERLFPALRPEGAMKDSGTRHHFESGAVRDPAAGKPRPDLVSPLFMLRLGERLRLGAEKYAERNWEMGIPQSRCAASLMRHLMQYLAGAMDEDHLAAVACNVMFLMHNEEMIRRGLLPAELDDLPMYLRRGAGVAVDEAGRL